MGWINFGKYHDFVNVFPVILFFLFNGCSSGDFKDRERAIALVQNYQIGGKKVSERLFSALIHSTDDKINSIQWNASRTKKNIYEVTCTVKMGNREIYFKWWANLSSNRISPLNMTTQDVMGGGFY